MEELARGVAEGRAAEMLLPIEEMVSHLPAVTVAATQVPKLLHGGEVEPAVAPEGEPLEGPLRLIAEGGELLAIGRWASRDGQLLVTPTKVLSRADEAI
jgi:hypothetical protein